MTAPHLPVLVDEVMAGLSPLAGLDVADGTFGAGGYSVRALAEGAGRVFGIDRDPSAIAAGRALEDQYEGRLTLVHERFSLMDTALARLGVECVDAIMLDIGVSSMQFDQAERGFSFQNDGPLDMRMSSDGPSAADLVNALEESELARIIYEYGEERGSRRIARAIVAARPVTRTAELADIVRRALGGRKGAAKDPATRTFQALRIAVNSELAELEDGMRAAERILRPGGRLAIVSFQSLEDRAVKRFFRLRSGGAPGTSRHLPQAANHGPEPTFSAPAKPVRPTPEEVAANPRARSATLRIAARTSAPPWPADTNQRRKDVT